MDFSKRHPQKGKTHQNPTVNSDMKGHEIVPGSESASEYNLFLLAKSTGTEKAKILSTNQTGREIRKLQNHTVQSLPDKL